MDSITPDKWFKTGDIAIRDSDGFYYIVDRRKELIKYKVSFFIILSHLVFYTLGPLGFPSASCRTGECASDAPRHS